METRPEKIEAEIFHAREESICNLSLEKGGERVVRTVGEGRYAPFYNFL